VSAKISTSGTAGAIVIATLKAMPLVRALLVGGLAGSVVVALPNYRPVPTRTCLARAHVSAQVGRPDRSLKGFGVTATVTFNFVRSHRVPTPQGLILYTPSPAAATRANARILRYLRQQAGSSSAIIPIERRRNTLVAWVSLPESVRQADTVTGCLARSA
jgi:hypothetical protein